MKYVFLLTLAVVAVACSQAVTATADHDGGSVELDVGDELEVALPGNPSTGYNWHVGAVDAAVLERAGEPTFKPQSELVGAPGLVRLRFTAVGKGSTTLELVYQRTFEEAPPLDTYVLQVDVS